MSYREFDLKRPIHTTSVAGYYFSRLFWIAVLGAVALMVWSYQPQLKTWWAGATKEPVAKKKTHQQREAEALQKEDRR